VRAHVELSYLHEATAHVGELRRMIQFKEKGNRPGARAALFTYPCLMAADILLYEARRVPVGGDQSQHVELCRDLALRFNATYGDTFVVPELALPVHVSRVLDLADPSVKMSKSAPDEAPGVIRILDGPDVIRRKLRRAVTDSDGQVRYDPEAKPGVSNLLEILGALTGSSPASVADGFASYGALKDACADAVVAALAPIRAHHDALMRDPAELARLLRHAAVRASAVAEPVVERARRAMGIVGAPTDATSL
jgi:tryptophanyl-tRNA synthetase